jgi:hypothetical protein
MVKVPTHLEVKVNETIHLVKAPNDTRVLLLNDMAPSEHRILSVVPQLHYTEKMFVLDPKRPFSGSAAYGMKFASSTAGPASKDATDSEKNAAKAGLDASGHGYLKSLNYKVDDKTITNAIELIAAIGPMLASPVAVNKAEQQSRDNSVPTGLHTTERTVAYGLFDLASPTFEEDLNSFLQLHVNNCSPCQGNAGTVPSKTLYQKLGAPPVQATPVQATPGQPTATNNETQHGGS